MNPVEEYVSLPAGPLVSIGEAFSVRPIDITCLQEWLDNPTLTSNGKSIGERNREYLHEKLDEFILRHGMPYYR